VTQAVNVALGSRSYSVVIGRGLLCDAGSRMPPLLKRGRVAVVTDRHVAALHGATLERALSGAGIAFETVVIEPGEAAKSFAGLEALCADLLALRLERGDLIVAFGGGVIGDLAGFAAAIYKRGVDFVQIPTTLLAQVDSSVGGKTAIDTPAGKNMIGAFHQPRLVLADLDVLETLPDRELACGMAEVVKYGLLGDSAFFEWLEARTPALLARDPDALTHAVRRSVEMKAAIVAEDEREGGARALLNLGHTFGHAVEAETGFGDALKHGEAVGLGCALAFRFSAALGLCGSDDAKRAARAMAAAGLPTTLGEAAAERFSSRALLGHMRQDKKASGGGVTLILARAIGQAFVSPDVDEASLSAFLEAEGATP
jgi:3-dehydroquinate synthase